MKISELDISKHFRRKCYADRIPFSPGTHQYSLNADDLQADDWENVDPIMAKIIEHLIAIRDGEEWNAATIAQRALNIWNGRG